MTDHEENVDWEVALKLASGRRDLLMELREIFLAEYPGLLANIAKALDAKSAKDLAMYAHRLKGSLRYFGSSAAADRSEELEVIGREQRMADASAKFEEVKAALDRLLPKLREGP